MRLLRRLAASLGVGGLATLVDVLALTVLVEVVGLTAAGANVPALLLGGVVQFVGCRHLVFRAAGGSMRRQLLGFAVVEIGTLVLNGVLFHALLQITPLPYAIARLVGLFLVFMGFSFPMWHLVFRKKPMATEAV